VRTQRPKTSSRKLSNDDETHSINWIRGVSTQQERFPSLSWTKHDDKPNKRRDTSTNERIKWSLFSLFLKDSTSCLNRWQNMWLHSVCPPQTIFLNFLPELESIAVKTCSRTRKQKTKRKISVQLLMRFM
jgi:hypothetical protein